jgi:hypothetical protein
MDTARHFSLPDWAIIFLNAVVEDIRKRPHRKPGVWKFKEGAVPSLSPKQIDACLRQPTTKVLKQWVSHYISVKFPDRPHHDPAVEHALKHLATEVASYKRGANSRNTQCHLRAEYGKQKGMKRKAEELSNLQHELELTQNTLEHVIEQTAAEHTLTNAAFHFKA